MIRDFTDEARQTFYELPKTITPPEAVTDLMNILADMDYRIKTASWFWDSVLESLVLKVSSYIGQFIDFEGLYQSRIDNIFENVSNVESDYSLRLETMTECMKAGIEQFRELSQIIAPDRVLQLKQMALKLKYTTGSNYVLMYEQMLIQGCKVREKSEMQAEVERYIDTMTQRRYNGKNSVKEMNNIADIQNFVYFYEYLHPDIGEKMDVLLNTGSNNPLTQDDKDKIKYIAYTADEPYRSLYLGYVGTYTIGGFVTDESGKAIDGAFYRPQTNAMYFMDGTAAFLDDPRGPYTTWFHESGHATDNNAVTGSNVYCKTYVDTLNSVMNQENVTLQEAIIFDVRKNIEDKVKIAMAKVGGVDVDKIVESFMYGGEEQVLSVTESYVRDKVISIYKSKGEVGLTDSYDEAASDIIGGVTNLAIDPGYGHRPNGKGSMTDEEYQQAIKEYRYWYDENGNSTGAQSKELFAEYLSYYITDNEAAIQSMRTNLPASCEVLDKMIEAMVQDLE